MIRGYVQGLKSEFKGYGPSSLVKDLMAGITVAAVALPLALAFGVSSGATAASGLLTAIVAGLAISILGGAFYQISGPTGAMAAILTSVVAQYGLQGVFTATVLAGVLLVLAGVFRLGRLTAFIPMPVIAGFTSGIAVIIALGQVDNFFGVVSEGESAIQKLLSYGHLGFSPSWPAVIIGGFVVLFMFLFPKKWNAVVPASLVAIILTTAASILFSLDVPTVGAIPKSLLLDDRFTFANFDPAALPGLISPAVSIAALGMVESLLCGASAGKMTGVRLKSDQELIAQGVGNILSPLFGGIPATAAIARTSVAIKSGAKTRLTGVFHALFLLVSMLLLGPVMSRIPLSALAGVLMVTAWRMNDWEVIRYFFSHRFKGALLQFFITMFATILFDLTVAIIIGVAVALVLLAVHLSKLELNYDEVDLKRMEGKGDVSAERAENAMVVYITGPIIFANVQQAEEMAHKLADYKTVYFSMRGVSHLDISGAQALEEMLAEFKAQGKQIFLCGVSESARRMLQRAGVVTLLGEEAFYWSVERALLGEEPVKA